MRRVARPDVSVECMGLRVVTTQGASVLVIMFVGYQLTAYSHDCVSSADHGPTVKALRVRESQNRSGEARQDHRAE